jgi:energy-coupling factor transporter transmembrane protein EcfT
MPKTIKIIKFLLIFMLVVAFIGCAPVKKNPWAEKRSQASKVHTSQLGRNKFYFSPSYQKKLNKNFKKK